MTPRGPVAGRRAHNAKVAGAIPAVGIAALLLVLLVASAVGQEPWRIDEGSERWPNPHDGDGAHIHRGYGKQAVHDTVRIAGIDAPESDQPDGPEAREELADFLSGEQLRPVGTKRDRYGRLIADLWTLAGKSAARHMVETGHAWVYREPRYRTADYETLCKLEAEARKAKRGLWARPNPMPPWEYRAAMSKPKG